VTADSAVSPVDQTGRGIALLRVLSAAGLLPAALFLLLFDRARHDPALLCVNPFAVDPYDAVGSFGVQLALAAGFLAALRAFRPAVSGESFAVRQTYILRAEAVSQLAIAVTMISNLAAMARAPSMWRGTPAGELLLLLTAALFVVPIAMCGVLIRVARRSGRCSQNPLLAPQMLPFVVCMALLAFYPLSWHEGITGALLTAAFGTVMLFLCVALLSKAMFPCPEVPEVDLIDDVVSIWKRIVPRREEAPHTEPGRIGRAGAGGALIDSMNPRIHPWRLIVCIAALTGVLLALADFAAEGAPHGSGRVLFVVSVFLMLESGGVCFGYLLLRHFLGIFRYERSAG